MKNEKEAREFFDALKMGLDTIQRHEKEIQFHDRVLIRLEKFDEKALIVIQKHDKELTDLKENFLYLFLFSTISMVVLFVLVLIILPHGK